MIPDEAAEAAARVLLGYTGECICHEGYTGRNLIDPDCTYHDVPPEVAREILEAAAPHLKAAAWDEGSDAGYLERCAEDNPAICTVANPYRP